MRLSHKLDRFLRTQSNTLCVNPTDRQMVGVKGHKRGFIALLFQASRCCYLITHILCRFHKNQSPHVLLPIKTDTLGVRESESSMRSMKL